MVQSTGSAAEDAKRSSEPGALSQTVCKIRSLIGAVRVVRADGAIVCVEVGSSLAQGDWIETGADGRIGITFDDGTAFNLASDSRMKLAEFGRGPDGILSSALLKVLQGGFAFVAGKAAAQGGVLIDTPLATVRGNARSGAVCTLTLVGLTIALLRDAYADPADSILIDDLIKYKDLYHGTLVIGPKGGDAQVIVLDDPELTIIIGPAYEVQQIVNSSAEMAALLTLAQDVHVTYFQGLADPFTTGSTGRAESQLFNLDPPKTQNTANIGGGSPPPSGGPGDQPQGDDSSGGGFGPKVVFQVSDLLLSIDDTDGVQDDDPDNTPSPHLEDEDDTSDPFPIPLTGIVGIDLITVLGRARDGDLLDPFVNTTGSVGTIVVTMEAAVAGAPSGLRVTGGDLIFLFSETTTDGDKVVVGREGSGGALDPNGRIAFIIYVTEEGMTLWIQESLPVDHAGDSNDFDSLQTIIDSSLLVRVTASESGFVVSGTEPVGDQIVFEDDGPTVTPDPAAIATLTMDESLPATGSTQDEGGVAQNDEATVALPASLLALGARIGASTADGTALFDIDFGADGPADTDDAVYTLTNSLGGAIADGTPTGVFDTATGDEVFLFTESGVLVGRAGADATAAETGPIVFAIAIDPDSGEIATAQYRAVAHNDPADHDESGAGEPTSFSGLIYVTVAATDDDGDTEVATSAQAVTINFEDDGPAITADGAAAATLTMDESLPGGGSTENEGGAAQNDEATVALPVSLTGLGALIGAATADGAALFNPTDFGTDGAAAANDIVYALTDSAGAPIADGTPAGVFDTATGNQVFLFTESGVLVGRAGADATAAETGPLVFAVSIDAETGEIATAQYRAVEHNDPADHDESGAGEPTSLAGLIYVTATATDGDGDSDVATSAQALTINFEDDGPLITADDSASATLAMDESLPGGGSVEDEGGTAQDDEATVALPVSLTGLGALIGAATADGAALFNLADFGADGSADADELVYALTDSSGAAIADGTPAGVFDTASGDAVFLFTEGGVLVGRAGADATAAETGPIVFAVAIDAETGEIATAQYRAVVHDDPSDHDENGIDVGSDDPTSLAGLIYVTATATDGDGDTSHATSAQALTINFEDDGPAAEANSRSVGESTQEAIDVQFIVDLSGSMFASGGGGLSFDVPDFADDRAGLVRYSMLQMLQDNPGITNVEFVLFGSTASASVWMDRDDAIEYIENNANWTDLGNTNYDLALETAIAVYDDARALPESPQTFAYFFSDGSPSGNGIAAGGTTPSGDGVITVGDWVAHITASGIDQVFAVGVGPGASVNNLEPIAYPDTDAASPIGDEDNVLHIDSLDVDALHGTLAALFTGSPIGGNVLSDDPSASTGADDFGSDGPGYIKSITVNDVTYEFDGVNTVAESDTTPDGYVDHGTWIEVPTLLGGTLTFYFADTDSNLAGSWTYVGGDAGPESFAYVIVDGDGDEAGATLDITVTPANSTPQLSANPATDNFNVRDEFAAAAYGNNNGTANWAGNWDESSDNNDDGPGAGAIRIVGGELRLGEQGGNGASLTREVDLSGAASATLSFDFRAVNTESGEEVIVYFAANGTNFVEIGRFDTDDADGAKSIPLTGPFAADAAVRFEIEALSDSNEFIFIDDVDISFTQVAVPTFTEGGAAVKIMPGATIDDPDNPPNFDGGFIKAAISGGLTAGDQLVLIGGLATLLGSDVQVGGVTVGAVTAGAFGTDSVTIALDADADDAAVEAILRSLGFLSTSDNPGTSRQIAVTFNDGGNTGGPGPLADVDIVTVHVVPQNDAPTATPDTVLTNVGANASVAIPTAWLVANDTDPDGDALTATGFGGASGGSLSGPSGGNITFNVDNSGGIDGSFTYQANDGTISSAAAAVTVDNNTTSTTTLVGNAGSNIIIGGGTNDTIRGGGGNDFLHGGGGNDLLDLSDATGPVTFTLDQSNDSDVVVDLTSVGLGIDTYRNMEGVIGSAFADLLTGTGSADILVGGGGADIIDVGGSSGNIVRFTATADYGDTIDSFDSDGGGQDEIEFTDALNALFDDGTADDNFTFAFDNNSNNDNAAVNLNGTIEGLLLDGNNSEGVANSDLLNADAVAAEFSREFSITASAGERTLLVINDTDGNSASIWEYNESSGAAGGADEIVGSELTLIALVNSNAAITSGNLDLA